MNSDGFLVLNFGLGNTSEMVRMPRALVLEEEESEMVVYCPETEVDRFWWSVDKNVDK